MHSLNRNLLGPTLLLFGICSASAADLMTTAQKTSEIKTFVSAVEQAGLTEKLKSGGPYTVFAPSNSAFNKLPQSQRDALYQDKAKLSQMLSQHIIAGRTLAVEVKPGPAKTLQGATVMLKSDNGKITLNEANVTLSDLEADNGVIHVIDSVILTTP